MIKETINLNVKDLNHPKSKSLIILYALEKSIDIVVTIEENGDTRMKLNIDDSKKLFEALRRIIITADFD